MLLGRNLRGGTRRASAVIPVRVSSGHPGEGATVIAEAIADVAVTTAAVSAAGGVSSGVDTATMGIIDLTEGMPHSGALS